MSRKADDLTRNRRRMVPRNVKTCAIYIHDFSGGGAEMVSIRLANAFLSLGLTVSLVVNADKGPLRKLVDLGVRIVDLNASRSLKAFVPLMRFLLSDNPDMLISGLPVNNLFAIAARRLSRWRGVLVVVQHNTLSLEFDGNLKDRLLAKTMAASFRLADRIVAVSAGAADDLSRTAPLSRDLITVIYNPIITPSFEALAAVEPQHRWYGDGLSPPFVAVGRLTAQKDYQTLLRALASARRTIEARLLILGEGVLLSELETLAAQLGIADSVNFLGFVDNPLPYIRCAQTLILSSRYEGFGNVLAEAMACGTPVISTACNGPTEILEGGRLGSLVPVGDAEAIARAMAAALNTEPDRGLLRRSAERFRSETIAAQYLALAQNAASALGLE